MKKFLSCLLTLALLLASTGVMAEGFNAGTYEGTAQGFGGEVKATVTLSDDAITDVTLVGDSETEGIGSIAIELLPEKIVAAQSTQIDAVASASVTSAAVFEAVNAALTAAGVDPASLTPIVSDEEEALPSEVEADVIVVGAGGAGMTAAITAAQAGKSVVILESQAMAGGNSVRATGGMNAAKTVYQDNNEFKENAGVEKMLESAAAYADNEAIAALAATVKEQWDAYQANPEGYFDSVELFELDTMVGGYGINNPTLVKAMAENSAAAIDWLSTVGADLTDVASFGGASVKRIHRPLNDEGKVVSVGAYIVPILQKACEDAGVTILFNTHVDEITVDENGVVTGVKATTNDSTLTATGKAVILATGGFGANLDMVASYKPELAGFATTNAAGAQGDGIAMAEKIGAATVDMEQIQIHPTVEKNTAALITEGLRGDGAILVNAEGLRFCDEVGTRDVVSAAEIAQTNGSAWLVIDQKMVDASSVIAGYITKGYTVQGDTYEALAEAMGVPAEAFAATMETWNACVAAGSDAEFGRTSFADPLDSAPYYAILVSPGVHHTMGGLVIDENTQVLKADGTAIAGLYAAGEVTGGVHGANRLGGNAVADFVVFGRIAGENAAEFVK